MEITRIQETHGQRVERAGSEQERRKRQQEQPSDFADDLQQEFAPDTEAAPPGASEAADDGGALPALDTVTLSPAGRVSSETLQARGGLRFSLPGNLPGERLSLGPVQVAPRGAAPTDAAAAPAPGTLDRLL
jgi:hypothetical protein